MIKRIRGGERLVTLGVGVVIIALLVVAARKRLPVRVPTVTTSAPALPPNDNGQPNQERVDPAEVPQVTQVSLYEQIGGQPALQAAVDEFYQRVLADPSLAPYFTESDLPRLTAHQRAFFSMALRGPNGYTGRSMREAHAGRGITDAAFDRVAQHLMDTLAHLGVSERLIQQIIARVAPLRSEIVERQEQAARA